MTHLHFVSRVRTLSVALIAMVALTQSACQVDLPLASKIEHMRVLGAVTEVEGDTERSSPKPGETAQVTWTMAYPDAAQDDSQLASLFYVCTAPTQFSGTPVCQELIDVAQGGSIDAYTQLARGREGLDCATDPDRSEDYGPFRVVCATGTPKLDVKVASDSKASAKLIRGIICRNGTPRFDVMSTMQMRCDPAEGSAAEDFEEISVYGTVPIQQGAATENHNPSLEAAELFFHESPLLWEESASEVRDVISDETCADLAYSSRVMSTDGHEEKVTLRYDADAREQLPGGEPETLTFTAYTTFGKISSRFTVFKPTSKTPLSRSFTWELSEDERKALNKKSKRVRFFFTVRDGRGGYASTTRDLCVVRQ